MNMTRMMQSCLFSAVMIGGVGACSPTRDVDAPVAAVAPVPAEAAAETPAAAEVPAVEPVAAEAPAAAEVPAVAPAADEVSAVVNEVSALIAGPLIKADGTAAADDALAGKTVALYFSAQWCPPCRAFTPVLVEAYNQWKEQEKPIELVFVSSDRNAAAMASYMSDYKMPWLAVPFEDGARRQALGAHWSIRGIPALVVVGPDGQTVSRTGTQQVRQHKAAAIDEWIKP